MLSLKVVSGITGHYIKHVLEIYQNSLLIFFITCFYRHLFLVKEP